MGDLIYICMRRLLNSNSVLAKIVICDVGSEESGKKQRNPKCYGSCRQTLEVRVLLSRLALLSRSEMLLLSL